MQSLTWTNTTAKLGQLKPWANNPRFSTKAQAKRLLKSWDELGQFQTIAIDAEFGVLDGHQRLAALLTVKGPEYEIAARQCNRAFTDEERQKLVVTAHVGAVGSWDWQKISGWEAAKLQEWGMDADTLKAWNTDATNLKEMLKAEAGGDGDAEPQIDRAEELNQKWQVKAGDLWRIGEHRLLCGDSTNREDVDRVMGGEKAGMMVTDPPYGVDYENEKGAVTNDDRCDWTQAYKLFAGDVAYVWHGERTSLDVGLNLRDCGFDIRARLIWVKPSLTMGRGNYHFQHEGAWYAVRKGTTSKWCGDHSQSTVWNIDRADEAHPTAKPLECMVRPIRNHDFEIIYEPFAGSGTTLVACQNLARRCRAIEISPAYCAVILERMATAFPELVIERL